MQLTAYEIALISGGFGIVGALLGSILSYRFATKLAITHASNAARQAEVNALRDAKAKLRAAFAPALAQIYLAQKHGDHDRPSIEDFVKANLFIHASAIEEFRPFVTGSDTAYQEAWESYREFANDSTHQIAADWTDDLPDGTSIKQRIEAILAFAKT